MFDNVPGVVDDGEYDEQGGVLVVDVRLKSHHNLFILSFFSISVFLILFSRFWPISSLEKIK